MATTTHEAPLIARLLTKRGLLPAEKMPEFRAASSRFPRSAEEALIRSGLADEKTVAAAHAENLGIAWLERDDSEGDPTILAHRKGKDSREFGPIHQVAFGCWDIADLISEAICRKYQVMPIAVQGEHLDLACLDPSHFSAIEEVRMRAGCIVRLHAATLSLLDALSTAVFGEPDAVREIASEGEGPAALGEDEIGAVLDLDQAIPQTKASQVQRIVNQVLLQAIEEGASDIHLEPYEDKVRLRYRVDGKLREVTAPPDSLFVPAISRLKILAQMDISERRVPQDGAIALSQGHKRVDLRVSTVPTVYGEKMCIRLLKKDGIPPQLTDLGFSAEQAAHFLDAARSPHGLMFVTGPTGSGKSTTLYCCLNLINDPSENIVTVEDPVEYRFFGLNQVHVRSKVGMSFATALRAFLRQDPDKIMVGEVRDQETAEICMRAALTGHLVLSTLHTNSALQVIVRLIDMGIEPFLLGPALRLLEAQRLARKLCFDCRVAYELPAEVAERHGLESGLTLYRAKLGGECPTCRGVGTKGRVGLYEVVPISERLRELVARAAPIKDLENAARAEGIRFLDDDARDKVKQGLISLDEVAQYIRAEH